MKRRMRMKKLRSLLCFVMATILMLGSSITVFAADDRVQYATATECEYELPENTDNSSDYFNFGVSSVCKYDLFSAVISAFGGRIVTPNFLSMRVQSFAILVAITRSFGICVASPIS